MNMGESHSQSGPPMLSDFDLGLRIVAVLDQKPAVLDQKPPLPHQEDGEEQKQPVLWAVQF